VKWFILRDGIALGRSDGAMIRLVTPITAGEDIARADRRLADFLDTVAPRLGRYVPS